MSKTGMGKTKNTANICKTYSPNYAKQGGISSEHWGPSTPTPVVDRELLELYSRFLPHLVSIELKDVPERDLVWREFQLLLLTGFFKHFLAVLHNFGRFGVFAVNVLVFYQMEFAIVPCSRQKFQVSK